MRKISRKYSRLGTYKAGVDLPTVKRISGHKTMIMVEGYAHQSGAHIAEALDRLDSRYRSAKKPA